MKQFLVMRKVEGVDKVKGLMAIPGLYTLEAAEHFVAQAADAEPESSYMIQEVGAA